MAEIMVNVRALCSMHPSALAQHHKRFLQSNDSVLYDTYSEILLRLVDAGALYPHVYIAWLRVALHKQLKSIVTAMTYSNSNTIRQGAIRIFAKLLKNPEWRVAWDAAGGTAGLVSIFAQSSVDHAYLLSKEITKSCQKLVIRTPETEREIEQLLSLLLPRVFNTSQQADSDARPLAKAYLHLLRACSSQFVRSFLLSPVAEELRPLLQIEKLANVHRAVFQDQILINPQQWFLNETFALVVDRTDLKLESQEKHNPEPSRSFLSKLVAEPGERLDYMLRHLLDLRFFQRTSLADLRPIVEVAIEMLSNTNNISKIKKDLSSDLLSQSMNAAAMLWIKVHRRTRSTEEDQRLAEAFLRRTASLFPNDQLMTLLKLLVHDYPGRGSSSSSPDSCLSILTRCPRHLRYQLLRTVFLLCKPVAIDLDDRESLMNASCPTEWSGNLFLEIGRNKGYALLQKLLQTRPNFSIIATSYHVFEPLRGDSFASSGQSVYIRNLEFLLRGPSEKVSQEADDEISWRKMKAQSTSDAAQRATWACSAMQCSIASQSLRLYEETVSWSHRYLHDYLTLKSLFQTGILLQPELLSILAALPEGVTSRMEPRQLAADVQLANKVIRKHFDLACQALREPSFNARDWWGLRELVGNVIILRIQRLRHLQSNSGFHALAEAVLPHTLELALDLERICLEPGHRKLDFLSMDGFFFTSEDFLKAATKPFPAAICTFLDTLALRRDALWQQVRTQLCSEVLSLPSIWPRGLPVQALLGGVIFHDDKIEQLMPYFSSRLRKVLDIRPDDALQTQITEVEQEAIGMHIDSFLYVLRCHVAKAKKVQSDVQLRLTHCYNLCAKLSVKGVNKQRQLQCWLKILTDLFPAHVALLRKLWTNDHPAMEPLPLANEEAAEWLPYLLPAQTEDSTRLIDYMLYGGGTDCDSLYSVLWSRPDLVSVFPKLPRTTHHRTRNYALPIEFRANKLEDVQRREAMIVLALLYLDITSMSSTRFLRSAFPDSGNSRFPAVFLADEFLSDTKNGFTQFQAMRILDRFLDFVPPTLLQRLLSRLSLRLERLQRTDAAFGDVQTSIFKILKLQARSDRPREAAPRMVQTFLNEPEAGSWYRQLLTVGYCKRLIAIEANNFLSSLVRGFLEQSTSSGKATISKVVTRGKLISRLLVSGRFLSPINVLEHLSNILQSAKHIDMIAATVESLLNLLLDLADDEHAVKRVLDALKVVLPRITGPSERRITTDEQWRHAEASTKLLDLPNITLEHENDNAPLAQLLFVDAYRHVRGSYVPLFVKEILLPAVDAAIAAQARWMRAFVRQQDPTLAIPEVLEQRPFRKIMVSALLRYWLPHVPKKYLQLEYYMTLTPLAVRNFADINATAEASRKETDNNAREYWLQVIATKSSGYSFLEVVYRLPARSVLPAGEGIEVSDVQGLLSQQFDMLLQDHDSDAKTYLVRLDKFLCSFRKLPCAPEEDAKLWNSSLKPLLRQMIGDIDALRTPQWQRNPDRWPARLPETYTKRLWLLPFPSWPHLRNAPDRHERFASAVLQELKSILATNKPYTRRWRQLMDAILTVPGEHYLELAVRLPRPEASSTDTSAIGAEMYTEQLLRCEMCAELLKNAPIPEPGDLVEKVVRLLEGWSRSPTEEARILAIEMREDLKRRRWPL